MNRKTMTLTFFALALALGAPVATASGAPAPGTLLGDWSGSVAVESRAFADQPPLPDQVSGSQDSLVFEPEYLATWNEGLSRFVAKPFLRLDGSDDERTHFDLRELYWQRSGRRWDLLLGLSKVFWGVTESQHLVDIVNQTDLVENPDGEDKLGQPMARLTLVRSWGIVDLFVLPGHRERTFPGRQGRLRPAPTIADDALYESGAEERHVDLAARWSQVYGPLDLGLSHFTGTTREPRFLPRPTSAGELELVPYYEQIQQTGLDLQATLGSWLWKLEAIRRSGQGEPFAAATAGLEYTFYGVFGSAMDVGAVAELLWDERGEGGPSPFEEDLFAGARLAFNDVQSTSVLAGAIVDRNSDAVVYLLEASRRLGSSWMIEAELRGFSGQPPSDPLAALRTDDYLQLSIQRHF